MQMMSVSSTHRNIFHYNPGTLSTSTFYSAAGVILEQGLVPPGIQLNLARCFFMSKICSQHRKWVVTLTRPAEGAAPAT